MNDFSYVETIPEIRTLLRQVDRKDARSVDSPKNLSQFVAGFLSYMPLWLQLLYRLRGLFVRLLGERQMPMDYGLRVRPEDVSYAPGAPAGFFAVVAGRQDQFFIAEARDRILSGYVAVAVQPLPDGQNRFHVLSMAKYRHWTAHIYYNVINLFHHLVVHCMVRNALK